MATRQCPMCRFGAQRHTRHRAPRTARFSEVRCRPLDRRRGLRDGLPLGHAADHLQTVLPEKFGYERGCGHGQTPNLEEVVRKAI